MEIFRRLSQEEAQELVKASEDQTNTPLAGFTFTPSTHPKYPASEGWEDVTYYTQRRRVLKVEPSVDKQYVYILSNPSMPGLLKIGYTAHDPANRVSQLDRSTSIPTGFKLEWAYPCYNGIELEGEVHKYLNGYRVNHGREFFKLDLSQAIEAVKLLGRKYNPLED